MSRSNINLVGNTTQGQNLGGGDACIFKGKLGGNLLQFRTISSTGDSIQLYQVGDKILISGATGGGDGTWGSITGTLSDQTDLWNELTGKTTISGTANYIPKFNATGDNIEDTTLKFTGCTLNNSTGLIIEAADNCGLYFNAVCTLINAGIIYLGSPTTSASITSQRINAAGAATNIGMMISPKGTGTLTMLSPIIRMYGGGANTGSLELCSTTCTLTFPKDGKISGRGGDSTSNDAYSLTIVGGVGYSVSSASGHGGKIDICGGNAAGTSSRTGGTVTIRGGSGISGGAAGRIVLSNLPAKLSETNVVYIDASGGLSCGAGGGDSYWSSGATGLSPAAGEDILLPANDLLKWSDSTCLNSDLGSAVYRATNGIRLCANTNYLLLNNTYAATGGFLYIGGLGSKGIIDTTVSGVISYGVGNCCGVVLKGGISTSSTGAGAVRICGGSNSSTGTGGDVCIVAGTSQSGSAGRIRLCALPAKSSETCVVYVDASGNLSQGVGGGGGLDEFTALTSNSNATWNTSLGLNRTWAINSNYTVTLTNVVNGMFGTLKVTITGTRTITLAGAGITFRGNGTLTSLPAGVYIICWVATSDTTVEWNLAVYT